MGYLFNGLKDDCCGADGKGTPGHSVRGALDQPQREVQVVRTLDDRGILEGSYIVTDTQNIILMFSSLSLKWKKLLEPTCMWHDCIGEMMSPHISIGIWGLRCSQPETKMSAIRCEDHLNFM